MTIPPIPKDEKKRLEALLSLDIMDSSPEEVFDSITALVCQILDCPIAAISLIDHERQWFKSIQGVSVSETSRDISFCGHTIAQKKMMIVADAAQDPRFFDNPLVCEEMAIRFYVGEPIYDNDGYAVGVLCALDRKSHELTDEQLKALKNLSKTVSNQLYLRKSILDLQKENSQVARLHNVTQSFLDKTRFEVADVDVTSTGIWYMIKDKLMATACEEGPQFLIEKIEQVLATGAAVVFHLDQLENDSTFNMKVTVDLIQRGKNGKDVFSLMAELAA